MGAIPSLKHTWEFNLNNLIYSNPASPDWQWNMGNNAARTIFGAMTSFSKSWTVISSSSGYTNHPPESVPWVEAGLTGHLNSGSWVTMVQSGTSPSVHLCFYFPNNFITWHIYMSYQGFSGSDPLNPPTAPDVVELTNGNPYFINALYSTPAYYNQYVHVMQSTDAKHFFYITTANTGTVGLGMLHQMSGHSDTWPTNFIGMAIGDPGVSWDRLWSDGYYYPTLLPPKGYYSGSNLVGALLLQFVSDSTPSIAWTGDTYAHTGYGGRNGGYNQLTKKHELSSVGLVGSTISNQGRVMTRLGAIDDMYVGGKALSLGNMYSDQLIHWGTCCLVTPWSGSVVMSY